MDDFADLFDMDSVDVTEDVGFDPLPAGEYLAEIKDVKIVERTNKAGREYKVVDLTFEIKDVSQSGKIVWDSIIIQHSSEKAQKIGRIKLRRLLTETKTKSTKADALVGKSILIRTGLEKYFSIKEQKEKEKAILVDFYSDTQAVTSSTESEQDDTDKIPF